MLKDNLVISLILPPIYIHTLNYHINKHIENMSNILIKTYGKISLIKCDTLTLYPTPKKHGKYVKNSIIFIFVTESTNTHRRHELHRTPGGLQVDSAWSLHRVHPGVHTEYPESTQTPPGVGG